MMDAVTRNLRRILNWSLRQQSQENGAVARSSPAPDGESSEERQRWLRESLDSIMRQPSETQLLKAALSVLELHSSKESLSSEELMVVTQSLEHVEYFVEDLDHASDLIPLNGIKIVNKYLSHSNSDLIEGACTIITSASQNHEKCQKEFTNSSLVQLMSIIKNVDKSSVQTKAFASISSIVRGYPPARELFLEENGAQLLMSCLKSDSPKLVIKTCFFLQYLYTEPHGSLELVVEEIVKFLSAGITSITDMELLEQSLLVIHEAIQQYPDKSLPIWREMGLSLADHTFSELYSISSEEIQKKMEELLVVT